MDDGRLGVRGCLSEMPRRKRKLASSTRGDDDGDKRPTMAELELRRAVGEAQSSLGGGVTSWRRQGTRRSGRSVEMHKVKTKGLRRLREIFWDGDSKYEGNGETRVGSGSKDAAEVGSGSGSASVASLISSSVGDGGKGTSVATAYNGDGVTGGGVWLNFGKRFRLHRIHASPHIYVIDDFLTQKELQYFDAKIEVAEREKMFQKSFVDSGAATRRGSDESLGADGGDGTYVSRASADDGGAATAWDSSGEAGVGARRPPSNARAITPDATEATAAEAQLAGTGGCGGAAPQQEQEDGSSSVAGGDDHGGKTGQRRKTLRSRDRPSRQRTSTFVHFSKMSDARVASVENRAADLLALPNHCIEPLQLVRYGPGQYFRTHHDMGVLFDDGSVELPARSMLSPPRRIVTLLVYLNDLPARQCGGETRFPLLGGQESGAKVNKNGEEGGRGLNVQPKRGRAVLWSNIGLDGMPDERTVHEGLPVVEPGSSVVGSIKSDDGGDMLIKSSSHSEDLPAAGGCDEEKNIDRFVTDEISRSKHDDSDDRWAQCDRCNKWRLLPPGSGVSTSEGMGDRWFCEMNVGDPERNCCDAPEVSWQEEYVQTEAGDWVLAEEELGWREEEEQNPEGHLSPLGAGCTDNQRVGGSRSLMSGKKRPKQCFDPPPVVKYAINIWACEE